MFCDYNLIRNFLYFILIQFRSYCCVAILLLAILPSQGIGKALTMVCLFFNLTFFLFIFHSFLVSWNFTSLFTMRVGSVFLPYECINFLCRQASLSRVYTLDEKCVECVKRMQNERNVRYIIFAINLDSNRISLRAKSDICKISIFSWLKLITLYYTMMCMRMCYLNWSNGTFISQD